MLTVYKNRLKIYKIMILKIPEIVKILNNYKINCHMEMVFVHPYLIV